MQGVGSNLVFMFILSLIAVSRQQDTTVSPGNCWRLVDLVFVLDGSNSLGSTNFQLMIHTVSDAVDVLEFGEKQARVGAVLYSSQIEAYIELQTNKTAFKSKLAMFQYSDEGTFTHLGIDQATKILTMNRRHGAPMVLVLITDGVSSDRLATFYSAAIARSKGIDFWAVGVSDQADMNELASLATGGTEQTLKIESFNVFADRLLDLTIQLCTPVSIIIRIPFTFTTTPPPTSTASGQTTLPTSTTTSTTPNTTGPETASTNYKDLCKNSISIGGVGHVLFPGDCTKVLQCYYNPSNNKTLVVTRKCPAGQFWDPSCMDCVPSYKVDCPYDKCKTGSCDGDWYGMNTYPMEGVCGGFWACHNQRSQHKCCAPGHTYIAGYGCSFGTTCTGKCGPEESCLEGLGICEKIPLWSQENSYGVATSAVGIHPTTCPMANFSIIECGCQIRLMDVFMQGTSECSPYHEIDMPESCSSNNATQIPIKHSNSLGPVVWRISLNVSEPEFEITSAPASSNCDDFNKLRVWADAKGVHAQLGRKKRSGPGTSILFKGWKGEVEVLAMLNTGLLTLAVKKDTYQYVSMAKAPSMKFCSDCIHNLAIVPGSGVHCMLNKVQLYNCKPEISDIYKMS